MSGWHIVSATESDAGDWAAMRVDLWREDGAEAHIADVAAMLARGDEAILALIARGADGAAVGFAEASVRADHVNGCEGSPVLFLEGIYVRPEVRRKRLGRALADAVAAWGAAHGLAEFASDAALDDPPAHAFHRAIGFTETERVVFFRRTTG